jgi:hypothetical protein
MSIDWNNVIVGDPFMTRVIVRKGDQESDHEFGPWKLRKVTHLQRDRKGKLACIAFEGVAQEFDPRNDFNPADNGIPASLGNERINLQFLE